MTLPVETKQTESKEKKIKTVKDIKTVRLYFPKDMNSGKLKQLRMMREQYLECIRYNLPYGWDYQNLNPDTVKLKYLASNQKYFPNKSELEIPKREGEYISGRLESSARNQMQGIINSRRKALLRYFYISGWCHKKNYNEAAKTAQRRIAKNILALRCPDIKSTNMELSSKVVKIKDRESIYDKFVFMFYYMWNEEGKKKLNESNKFNVAIPVNKRSIYWEKKGYTLKSGILVGDGWIEVRYEKEIISIMDTNVSLFIDQGANSLIVAKLSTGETYESRQNKHGKDLKSIVMSIMRKRVGSKARKRAIKDMINYVKYSVNTMFHVLELDKGRIGTLVLEDIRHMQGTNKFLSMLPFGVLRECLENKCNEYGIKFKFQGNSYRSQRCFYCGYVHKNNRKGKVFMCKKCDYVADADFNAVDNHSIDIKTISYEKNKGKLDNRKNGFYWLETGVITDVNKFPDVVKYKP